MSWHTHLDDHKLSSTVHLACFRLPYPCRSSQCAGTHTSYNASDYHNGDARTARLYDRTYSNDRSAKYDLTRATKNISSPDSTHRSNKTANIIDRGHHPLHVRRGIPESLEKVLGDDDIAEDALVIAIEAVQFVSLKCHQNAFRSTHTRTVDAHIEIHTVNLSPDPPRYLRTMVATKSSLITTSYFGVEDSWGLSIKSSN